MKREGAAGLQLLMEMQKNCSVFAFLRGRAHVDVYMCWRFEHVICHLIGIKLGQGHMPQCGEAWMTDKYVNASCEVCCQHLLTSNRQMVDCPVHVRSESTEAISKLSTIENI